MLRRFVYRCKCATRCVQGARQIRGRRLYAPVFPAQSKRVHNGFEDPAAFHGAEEERLALYRRVQDEIRDYLKVFPSQGPSM
jgi:hypothetical protein